MSRAPSSWKDHAAALADQLASTRAERDEAQARVVTALALLTDRFPADDPDVRAVTRALAGRT